jgi:hypothetical protein
LLLHVTSLPSPYGIGDLGASAFSWIDRLHDAAQGWWQASPLGPTDYGNSPYQSMSSCAGNALLISPGRFREGYHRSLDLVLHHRRVFLVRFFAACLGSLALLIPWLGQDFFPSIDAGSFKMHLRGPTGMRIENTAFLCDLVEN